MEVEADEKIEMLSCVGCRFVRVVPEVQCLSSNR